jgi:hypothetical protein
MTQGDVAELTHLRNCARMARKIGRDYWEARRKFGNMDGRTSQLKTWRYRYRFILQERLREKAELRVNSGGFSR